MQMFEFECELFFSSLHYITVGRNLEFICTCFFFFFFLYSLGPAPEWVLLGILGGGVPPGSPNPYPISDQKISFSIPVFRPDL